MIVVVLAAVFSPGVFVRRAKFFSEQSRKAGATAEFSLGAGISQAKTVTLAQDQAIQDASGVTVGGGSYGIVVSADKTDELAEYELRSLKRRNIRDIAVYNRQNFLRTIARFETKRRPTTNC